MSSEKNKRIYLSSPHLSGEEEKYLEKAFRENWVAPLGPNVDAFEMELSEYCGVKHAAALSSGTAAIHLALKILDIGPEDFVICQSLTFAATAFPIRYQGATPIFIDSESDTWNMDPQLLEKAIRDCLSGSIRSHKKANNENSESRKIPKAIIPVHLYGMPYKVDEIHQIADTYGIPVIEDAAEALGSTYDGAKCGSFGKLGVLSFNGNKIITTSGGGALLSNEKEVINKARFLATQARDPAHHYEHSNIGYNYRLSNILAGIGRGQLEVIDDRVKRRRDIFQYYKNELAGYKGITLLSDPASDKDHTYDSNHWLTTILIDRNETGFSNEDLRIALEAKNIEARPIWKPMHLQPVFGEFPACLNKELDEKGYSAWLFDRGLCLPSGSNMTDNDLNSILSVIIRLIKKQ